MNQIICDRCDKEITLTERMRMVTLEWPEARSMALFVNVERLCPDCARELRKWMKL